VRNRHGVNTVKKDSAGIRIIDIYLGKIQAVLIEHLIVHINLYKKIFKYSMLFGLPKLSPFKMRYVTIWFLKVADHYPSGCLKVIFQD